jgi:hypothetical protein
MGLREAVREKTHTNLATHSPNHRIMVSALDKASAPPMPPPPPPFSKTMAAQWREVGRHVSPWCVTIMAVTRMRRALSRLRMSLRSHQCATAWRRCRPLLLLRSMRRMDKMPVTEKRLPKLQSDESPSPVRQRKNPLPNFDAR